MKRHNAVAASITFACALASVLVVFAAGRAAAQGRGGAANAAAAAAARKPTPKTPDGHPDLNGLWNNAVTGNLNGDSRQFEKSQDGSVLFDFGIGGDSAAASRPQCIDDSCQLPNQPPYKPEYMQKVKEIANTFFGATTPLDPEMQCKPYGIPRGSVGGAMQIVQTPKVIAILYEGHPQPSSVYRVIYMNSPHPKDLDPSYDGDSRGHWEGDTLVVDVTGLNDETWLGGGVEDNGARKKYTSIHSDKEHVVERWTRKGDTITYEATVDDPVMFTRPWVITPKTIYVDTVADDQLLELFCTPQATGSDHFVKPSEAEKNSECGSLGKAEYDACMADAAKKGNATK